MANERITENLVRALLIEQGYTDNPNIIIEEQKSSNPKVDKLLKTASKKGVGRGYPEFIITFINKPDNIVVIECKASISKHKSKTRKEYADYAVDGALLYASYLKNDFNVMAIAVSGQTNREIQISHFSWLKGKQNYKDVSDKSLLDPKSLFNIIEKQSAPLREDELIEKAIEYNKKLHSYSIPEVERCTLISSILVALQDRPFAETYNSYHTDDDQESVNPNEDLISALLVACERVLKRNHIDGYKSEVILREYAKVRSNNTLQSKKITVKRVEKRNLILRELIDDINENIMPYINENVYDILGQFYTQFIRYAGSDSKTGLVLTPPHITDLFCDLANVTSNDVILDPCCGTGGFLVSAMKYMLGRSGNNEKIHQKIKSKQLIGVEKRADMFSHVCSNMMMRGDGKSSIFFGDCFNQENIDNIKALKPTKAFLNPPYDVGEDGQLDFIDNSLECLEIGGTCIAICQMSAAISGSSAATQAKKRLMQHHTLEAVLSMPDDLFHPVGVITCIIIFTAHTPHPSHKETFFGYFKDDGYIKSKGKGRLDSKNQWQNIKEKWLDAYANRKEIAGLSVCKKVTPSDEWCAEAYMTTDYTKITHADFAEKVKDFAVFNLLSNRDCL